MSAHRGRPEVIDTSQNDVIDPNRTSAHPRVISAVPMLARGSSPRIRLRQEETGIWVLRLHFRRLHSRTYESRRESCCPGICAGRLHACDRHRAGWARRHDHDRRGSAHRNSRGPCPAPIPGQQDSRLLSYVRERSRRKCHRKTHLPVSSCRSLIRGLEPLASMGTAEITLGWAEVPVWVMSAVLRVRRGLPVYPCDLNRSMQHRR